jgi:hypothetical protein
MSKKITNIILFSLLAFLIATPIFAVDISPFQKDPTTASPITNVTDVIGPSGILVVAIQWIYTTFFIVAVLFILMAAYNFIRGGTNPKAIETAKAQLKYAVIAIVIALVASGASAIIDAFLSGK